MFQAIISTFPKPGKSLDNLANFHPISLLNNDINFFSKLLANRLKNILLDLISADQVGFIQGRQARDGTHHILDLIKIAKTSPADSVFLSLDT